MEVLANRASQGFFYVPMERLNPDRRSMVATTPALVSRYSFLKFPTTYQDYSAEDGVFFGMGSFRGYVAEMKIYPNGVVIATGGTTDLAREMFDDVTALWRELGLSYEGSLLREVRYLTELVVHSVKFGRLLSPRVLDVVAEYLPQPSGLASFSAYMNNDPNLPMLRIERLNEVPPSADQFWCQAPLATDRHVAFLEALEAAIE